MCILNVSKYCCPSTLASRVLLWCYSFEQNLECVVRPLVTENSDLQSKNQTKDRELVEARQQLREKVNVKQTCGS